MTIKTITVTEEAYESIKRLKAEDESFSELFKRLSGKPLTIKEAAGILKHTSEQAEEFRKRVKEIHERLGEGLKEGIKNVRTRFERSHRSF